MTLLSAFNPHGLPERTVRAIATGRKADLAKVLRIVRGNIGSATIQHVILTAPRGYGKSFMMRHIQIELERIAREEKLPLRVVLMPEEMPHVKEPETLIREITRELTRGAATDAELTWHEDEEAWEAAVADLRAAIAEHVGEGGLFVAQVESFDVLLRHSFQDEIQRQRLRNLLTEMNGRIMLIAASARGAVDRDYDRALFHAFREIRLQPWSVDECMAFFDRQRKEAGKPPLSEVVRAKAQAVAAFIGGTPRLATLLGDALFDADVLRAADLLQRLVDELTPYYKERIDALPGRAQKLFDALLRGGEPATQSELARRVNANSQAAIAGTFNHLRSEQIVISEKAPRSAEVLYRVADRVFAHYYRRRIIDHGHDCCPLEGLVDLLADYFSAEEKREKAEEFLRASRLAEARLMARLYDSALGISRAARWWILYNLQSYYIPQRLIPLASRSIAEQLRTIAAAAADADVNLTRVLIEDALKTADPEGRVLLLLARSALDAYEGVDTGLSAAEDAAKLVAEHGLTKLEPIVDLCRARSLATAGRHQEAYAFASELSKRLDDPSYRAMALRLAAFSLGQLGDYVAAVAIAERAAGQAREAGDVREEAVALRHTAFNLGQLGDNKAALAMAERAATLAREGGDTWEEAVALRHAAVSLGQLGDDAGAVAMAARAAERARAAGAFREATFADIMRAGALRQLGRFDEAFAALAEAARLAASFGDDRQLCEFIAFRASKFGQGIGDALARDVLTIDSLHGLLGSARQRFDVTSCGQDLLAIFVAGVAESTATMEDADKIETVAQAIALHFRERFNEEVAAVRAVAAYFRAGRDPVALARIDPDFASTIQRLHPPAEQRPTAE
jgi:tetratricopeptide (TPR) repeat protein